MRAGRTIVEVELGSAQIVKNFLLLFSFIVVDELYFFSDLWEMGILSPRVREMQEM